MQTGERNLTSHATNDRKQRYIVLFSPSHLSPVHDVVLLLLLLLLFIKAEIKREKETEKKKMNYRKQSLDEYYTCFSIRCCITLCGFCF